MAPHTVLTQTIRSYSFLERERLRNELSVLQVPKDMWRENLLDCREAERCFSWQWQRGAFRL